jgi:hypothetical protein
MNDKLRLLSLDVEKNGLHGIAFAVGAVVLDHVGNVLDTFRGRSPIDGTPRDFVKREVLPALVDYPETHSSSELLRVDFWNWFSIARIDACVFADCGWPSEARFFIALVEDDLDVRYLQGPFPLHDVSTLLLAAGVDPHINRVEYAGDLLGDQNGFQHDPWWDAFVSGHCALRALRALGTIPATTVE